MEKTKLTLAIAKEIPIPKSGRIQVGDTIQAGLTVRVTNSGVRSWYLYRKINGTPYRRCLGYVSEPIPQGFEKLNAEQARKACAELYVRLSRGDDPKAHSTVPPSEKTLQELLDEYIHHRENSQRGLKPRTIRDYGEAANETYKEWLPLRAASITPDMARIRYREKNKSARASNGMRVLRAVYRYAIDKYPDEFQINPTSAVEWQNSKPKRTYLKQYQLQSWWEAVCALESSRTHSGAPEASVLLRLYLLTGMRKSEALNLRWEDIDLPDSSFTLWDTKNRDDVELPLSDYACTMLRDLRLKYPIASSFVFPNRRKPRQPLSNVQFWQRQVHESSGVQFSLHDLRRTFVTYGAMEVPEVAIKKLVNHRNAADVTLAHYAQVPLESLRRHSQTITNFFLQAVGEAENDAEADSA